MFFIPASVKSTIVAARTWSTEKSERPLLLLHHREALEQIQRPNQRRIRRQRTGLIGIARRAGRRRRQVTVRTQSFALQSHQLGFVQSATRQIGGGGRRKTVGQRRPGENFERIFVVT